MGRGTPDAKPNAADKQRIEAVKVNAVNAIWTHTRINKDSLEAERHCRIIREKVDAAVDASTAFALELLDRNHTTIAGLRTQNKELRARVSELERKLERINEQ